MHAKTDSEVTSLDASSTTRSPRRAVYYVQSPSHDGEKTTTSLHSTPVLSPMGSPPHSHSSSSRFSGSRKINSHHRNHKPWKDIDVIEEEGLLQTEDRDRSLSRRYYFLAFVLGFFILFSFFSLILWGASRPMKPKIVIKSIKFDHLRVQAGSDATGVATDMITMNSTVKLTYRNTGTFFGVHVTGTPLDLSYSEIVIATGNLKKFYQSRKSQRLVSVAVMGNKIPLYGSGASLSSTTGMPTVPVPLKLSFVIRSRAYVLGRLVKPKYYKTVQCSINLDPKKIDVPVSLKNSCTYD
ncbi:Late embryogenesis abundant protein, LEA-14 [Spatholobus suberectus]|nr:Late embryogenesis abundant protein, LEA-14 [Spatholobus suberectus]